MSKTIYHLSTCQTCKRVIAELNPSDEVKLHDVKANPITEKELKHLHKLAGSYEELFSRRAQLYRSRNLKEQTLSEEDCKALILEHYTFLKRPIVMVDDALFIGSSKKVVEAAKAVLE